MRLRLFFRGEKEYRAKRPRPHRVDTDGDTESEPEEKKIERRKKKFRLDIHDDQVNIFPRSFYLSSGFCWFSWCNLHVAIWSDSSLHMAWRYDYFSKILAKIASRYCNYYHWFRWLSLSSLALATPRWCLLPLLGRSWLCWFCHRFGYL